MISTIAHDTEATIGGMDEALRGFRTEGSELGATRHS